MFYRIMPQKTMPALVEVQHLAVKNTAGIFATISQMYQLCLVVVICTNLSKSMPLHLNISIITSFCCNIAVSDYSKHLQTATSCTQTWDTSLLGLKRCNQAVTICNVVFFKWSPFFDSMHFRPITLIQNGKFPMINVFNDKMAIFMITAW